MEFINYGYLGLFISSFLSATVLPLASEAVFGIMILNGYDPVACTVIASAGNFLGGATSYYLGMLGNWKWIEKYLGVKKSKVVKSKIYLDKYGAYTALISWVPIIGDIIVIMLGFYRVKVVPVMIYMLFGKIFRYGVLALSIVSSK